jgi:hypothetical protein
MLLLWLYGWGEAIAVPGAEWFSARDMIRVYVGCGHKRVWRTSECLVIC